MTNFSFTHLLEAQQAASTGEMLLRFLPFLLLIPIFYFFMYRPQKKQERETAQMRNNLIIGDEIVTIGGIMGRVVKVKEDYIIIETGSDRTKLKIRKTAVGSVEKKSDSDDKKQPASFKVSQPKPKDDNEDN
jgi:preprotein translocase subunit YajC